jgi:Zn-dependent protease with chaperone function
METSDAEPGQAGSDESVCARYCRWKLWLGLAEAGAQIVALAGLTLTGASRWLLALDQPVGPRWLLLLVYLAQLGLVARVAALPWRFLNDFLVERRFGLGTQPASSWFWEWVCRSALFGSLAVALLYPVSLTLPWWRLALLPWLVYFLSARALYFQWLHAPLLHRLYPTEFLRFESFHLPDLGSRTLPVYQVRVSDRTRRVDAYLHLAGRRSAIYVTDTLIDEFTDGEEKVVMAHEFGHLYDRLVLEACTPGGIRQANRKLAWTLVQAVAVGSAFAMLELLAPRLGLSGASDLAGFPLLVALTMTMSRLLAPLIHLEARRDETDADEYALTITGDVENYRSVIAKLQRMNLEETRADPLAHFLFDTHPTCGERLMLADRFATRRPPRRRRPAGARR